jgi:hypothetical protein
VRPGAYFTSHFDRARRTAYALCGNWGDAEEITQHAFVRVYPRWPKVRRESAEAYLRTVVTRLFLDGKRRGRGREQVVADPPELAVSPDTTGADERQPLLDALQRGPQQVGTVKSPATLPARTPHWTWTPGWTAPPPPGRAVVDIPMCDQRFGGATGAAPLGSVQLTAEFAKTLAKAVTEAARPAEVSQMHTKVHTSGQPGSSARYSNFVDVTDSAGTGSVWFNAGAFLGTPTAAADEQAFDTGNCAPPRRPVLPNGTVLQFYSVHPSEPFQLLSQALRIYTPDGRLYEITVQNSGSPDLRDDPAQPEMWDRFGKGRETLPLTEAQLTRIGLAVAEAV